MFCNENSEAGEIEEEREGEMATARIILITRTGKSKANNTVNADCHHSKNTKHTHTLILTLTTITGARLIMLVRTADTQYGEGRQ